MKIFIHNRNLPVSLSFDSRVKMALRALEARHSLHEAKVVVERLAEAGPPYRVRLHVAVPGPDLHQDVRNYSAWQAFAAAMAEVERSLRFRVSRRLARNRRRALRTAGVRFGGH